MKNKIKNREKYLSWIGIEDVKIKWDWEIFSFNIDFR